MTGALPTYMVVFTALLLMGAYQAPSLGRAMGDATREFRTLVAARYGRSSTR